MLIQGRGRELRLVPQHEHGLVAGEMAEAWRGLESDGVLSDELVLAVALHDLAWIELDEEPRWDPETGRPVDFLAFPSDEKYRAAAEALDRIEELHPYAAVLVSLHYTTFGSPGRPPAFEESEEERRLELLAEMGDAAPPTRRIRLDLERLRLFDNLSLWLCLAPPGSDPTLRPDWLRPELLRVPGTDARLHMEWEGEDTTARIDPWPFAPGILDLEVGCRDLRRRSFESREELAAAWRRAPEVRWPLELRPPGS